MVGMQDMSLILQIPPSSRWSTRDEFVEGYNPTIQVLHLLNVFLTKPSPL